jgi:chorismate mutase / prephenate dehydratase
MAIESNRRRIDELDAEIVRLLNERAECAIRIGKAKEVSHTAPYAPARERQVLEKVAEASAGPLPRTAVQAIYREVISACRALERRLSVAYWGPPASNTHVAARMRFGSEVEFVEASALAGVFDEVEHRRADFGVVPVENSTEGVINQTLDRFLTSDLQICAEVFVPISHNLLSRAGSLAEVRRVYTMFQATAQCREWIARNLAGVELVDTTTTARAAELAAADPEAAAIAGLAAAEQYSLSVVCEHIEDNPRNWTRFWVVGSLKPAASGRDKTSLLFAVPHRAGALVQALSAFAEHGVSLSFIESRPTKQTPWEYLFFVDVQGHAGAGDDTPLARALESLRERTMFIRVLGSYPEAESL